MKSNNPNVINGIYQAKRFENVMNSAIGRLERANLTIAQLRSQLYRKTNNTEWIEFAIEKCLSFGYLKQDDQFCVQFADSAFRNEKGRNYIIRKLRLKKLPDAVILLALETVESDNQINEPELIKSRLSRITTFEGTSKEKVTNDLVNKHGFQHKDVAAALKAHPLFNTIKTKLEIKGEKTDLAKAIVKLAKKGKGPNFIKQKLKQDKVDITNFDDTVEQLEHEEQIDFWAGAANELSKKNYDFKDFNDKQKAYAFLANRGFLGDHIKEAINASS
ncbi:RecX family transcriptional regulator [Vibrio barjaei]|uniref:RecX family transcriptional regulator n=1 Tax=Vibrio barjaei TaxID=1676683 RepID=UPI002284F46E|nr:RecX family transcriptional regulator [Vibrio barjaei]MCY9870477.1 RecX family transcriptional regulator [Vibrio barjaei]